MTVRLEDFIQESECIYKGERYSVRDNGSVMRYHGECKRPRPVDDIWTFGRPNDKNYLRIGSEVVHRIVATAFHGAAPTSQHVVDHIDTNRHNNRPENLRWVTKLENILLNPITVKNIIYACGSIEAFLADPSILQDNNKDTNFQWMRRVSVEEADTCLKRLKLWAEGDAKSSGGNLDEWVFNRNIIKNPLAELISDEITKEKVVQFIDNAYLNGVKQVNKHTNKCTTLRQISTKFSTKSNLSHKTWSIRLETYRAQG